MMGCAGAELAALAEGHRRLLPEPRPLNPLGDRERSVRDRPRKMRRNRPVAWLKREELDAAFFEAGLKETSTTPSRCASRA